MVGSICGEAVPWPRVDAVVGSWTDRGMSGTWTGVSGRLEPAGRIVEGLLGGRGVPVET